MKAVSKNQNRKLAQFLKLALNSDLGGVVIHRAGSDAYDQIGVQLMHNNGKYTFFRVEQSHKGGFMGEEMIFSPSVIFFIPNSMIQYLESGAWKNMYFFVSEYRDDTYGANQELVVFNEEGDYSGWRPREYEGARTFVGQWVENMFFQHNLDGFFKEWEEDREGVVFDTREEKV